MDKKIATLIEALCDRPLAAGGLELSASPRHSAAANAIGQPANASPNAVPDPESDVDRVATVLASILSGMHVATARGAFDEAALRAAAVRLDAQSALAFLERMERSPETAPVHLVEQILAAVAPQQPTSSREASRGILRDAGRLMVHVALANRGRGYRAASRWRTVVVGLLGKPASGAGWRSPSVGSQDLD